MPRRASGTAAARFVASLKEDVNPDPREWANPSRPARGELRPGLRSLFLESRPTSPHLPFQGVWSYVHGRNIRSGGERAARAPVSSTWN